MLYCVQPRHTHTNKVVISYVNVIMDVLDFELCCFIIITIIISCKHLCSLLPKNIIKYHNALRSC